MRSAMMRPSQHQPPLYGAAFPSPATSGNSASPQKSATAPAFVPHASPKYDEEGEDERDGTDDEKQKLEWRRERNRVKQRNLRREFISSHTSLGGFDPAPGSSAYIPVRRANHLSGLEQNIASLQEQHAALSAAVADFRHRERQLDAWIKDLENVLQRNNLASEVEALRRKWLRSMNPSQRRDGDDDPLSTLAQAAASVPSNSRQGDAGPSVLHPPPHQYGTGIRPLWNRGQASPFTWEPAANDSPFEYDVDPRKRKRGSEELAPPPPRPLSGYRQDPLAPPSVSVPWDPPISRPSSSRPQTAPSAPAFEAYSDAPSGATPSGSITDPSPRAMRIESLLSPNPDGLHIDEPTPARPSWSTEMTLIDNPNVQRPRSIEHGSKWHDAGVPSSPLHHLDDPDLNPMYPGGASMPSASSPHTDVHRIKAEPLDSAIRSVQPGSLSPIHSAESVTACSICSSRPITSISASHGNLSSSTSAGPYPSLRRFSGESTGSAYTSTDRRRSTPIPSRRASGPEEGWRSPSSRAELQPVRPALHPGRLSVAANVANVDALDAVKSDPALPPGFWSDRR